jgi:hypothetical protein
MLKMSGVAETLRSIEFFNFVVNLLLDVNPPFLRERRMRWVAATHSGCVGGGDGLGGLPLGEKGQKSLRSSSRYGVKKFTCLIFTHLLLLHQRMKDTEQKTVFLLGILTPRGVFEGRKILRNSPLLCSVLHNLLI